MSTEITIQQDQIDINVDTTTIVIESPTGGYPLPSSVYSVFGRVGNVIAQDGDYTLTQLGDVTISNPLTGQALVYNGTAWVNNTETYVGTVTSVNMSVPTGLTISGNPITTSGTLAVGLASGYSIPTNASQATWDTAYSRSLTSAAVTGTTTKTLTLNEQGGGTITATWSDYDTAPVTSVFGRTGAITAQSGDYNTLQVTENTNLYFTDQRARYAISGDSNSGVVYSNTTGIIALDDIPNTSLLNPSLTVNGKTVALGGTVTLTTTDVAEGTNLYYTQARFNSAFAAKTTTDLTEGANLYFTNARAQAAITGTAPISVTSGNVTISQSGTSTNGYLSSTDWNTFNSKQGTLTLTTTGNNGSATLVGSTLNVPTYTLAGLGGISLTGLSASSPLSYNNTTGAFSIQVANASQNGYLSSSDWSTFNGKQAALSGTGFVKISGTTISYDNSTYLTTISGIAAGGELSGTYASPSLVNSAVTGKVLTGVNITGGTIQATDSILTAFGKVQNQINGLIGGSIYKGTWNASTNTPSLASGVGTTGWYYIVNVAGSTNLDGITDWNVGDWAIFDGTAWQQVDNTDAVVSVNGFTGAVSLTTSNISEGTNLYYTDARARASNSAGTGISYNSTTGVITNSAPDQVVSLSGAGTTSISGTYPNFTITSNDQYVGTVTSVGITESAAALNITGSPVTTSGNINIGFAGTSSQYVAGDGSLGTLPSLTGYVPYTGATNDVNIGAKNYYGNSYFNGFTSISASGTTYTLTINSAPVILVNGSGGQTIKLPDATTLPAGTIFSFNNNQSSGAILVNNNSNTLVKSVSSGAYLTLELTDNTSAAGNWDAHFQVPSNVSWSTNTLDYTGSITNATWNGAVIQPNRGGTGQSTYTDGQLLIGNSTGNTLTKATLTAGTGISITNGGGSISIASTITQYTDALARAAISLTTTGNNGASTYNSTTGVLNIPTYTLAGLGGINLTSLSATSPLLYNNTTGVFSIQQSSGSQAGYLSSADWTTFNSKQSALTNPVTGTGTTNYLPKFTGASTLGNSLIYDNGTSVGINTSTLTSGIPFSINVATGNNCNIAFQENSSDKWYIRNITSSNALSFYSVSGSNETMRLTSTGNAGISITPSAWSGMTGFDVGANASLANFTDYALITSNNYYNAGWFRKNAGYATSIFLRKDDGSIWFNTMDNGTAGSSISAVNTRMIITNAGNVGIGTSSPTTYSLSGTHTEIFGGSSYSFLHVNTSTVKSFFATNESALLTALFTFSNHPLTFGTNNTERMRITSTGAIYNSNAPAGDWAFNINGSTTSGSSYGLVIDAGTTSADTSFYVRNKSAGVPYFRVRGDGYLQSQPTYSNTTASGANVAISSSGYFERSTSSIKYKKDVRDYDKGLAEVMQMRPVYYKGKGENDGDKQFAGLIAEEIHDLGLNEFVTYAEDGTPDALHYANMIALLTKAIQELNAKVSALENKS
jgi:hypothetical protein